MYRTTKIIDNITAQRFDDSGKLIEEITIPKGTTITIIDMGDCAQVVFPDKYKGLMFTDGYEGDECTCCDEEGK